MYPIHWAVSQGNSSVVKHILSTYPLTVNLADHANCTPFLIAIQYNHTEIMIALINTPNVDLFVKDSHGDGALHWAAYKGHETALELLMGIVPQTLENEDNYGQVSPLYVLCCVLRGGLEEGLGADCSLRAVWPLVPHHSLSPHCLYLYLLYASSATLLCCVGSRGTAARSAAGPADRLHQERSVRWFCVIPPCMRSVLSLCTYSAPNAPMP